MRSQSLLLISLSVISLVCISLSLAPAVHASGLVYVLPEASDVQPIGSSFTVQVQVAGMDQFDGWQILIRSDPSVINATSLSIAGNIFDANATGNQFLEPDHCINGVPQTNPDCASDGLGTVHSSVVYFGGPSLSNSNYGLLFTITYKVVGLGAFNQPYSPIEFKQDIISNPGPVSHTTQGGIYGIPPGQGFTITASPPSARILIGSKVGITLNVSSFGGYSGTVDLTTSVSSNGLNLYLNVSSVSASPAQPSFANLTVVSDSAYNQASKYTVTVTATGTGFPEQLPLTINTLERPSFLLGVSPSRLKIHGGNSGSSIVTLAPDPGFSGTVHLTMDVPPIPGLMAHLGATDFILSENTPNSTTLSVRTPASEVPFLYQINITATSQLSTHIFTIYVVSPSPDYSFQIGASSFVVQAGQSRTFTLNATAVDYFTGKLYLLASSLSGIKEIFSNGSLRLDSTNSSTRLLSSISLLTITTDANLAPGNHYINVTALGTTFLGALGPQVNHSVILTVTVTVASVARTILGLQPTAYFGVVGALWLGLIGIAIREIRRPKAKRFLS